MISRSWDQAQAPCSKEFLPLPLLFPLSLLLTLLSQIKALFNAQVYELLIVFVDWISDYLSTIKSKESGMDNGKLLLKFLLPVVTEQLQCMLFVNTKLCEPFVKFETGKHIFRGVVTKGIQDSLQHSVESNEGKVLFLDCQAVPVILNHLRISGKGLLSTPFLEAYSNTLFFCTCFVLLQTPKLNFKILKKLSIILQEAFQNQETIHLELAFLCINLNSTLFNLGLTKCNSLASNASD
ncbi:unnamed protein product [Nyctereutes procyonoides]|uniref:(raccoon dog) hypothetical protein n=1 Tax=Nyctereutes procyonoides TaxID=34880 RepID=A0A811ZNB0_NYCPR|nr:unnamed protein product [Nyctereutes procyonoides]